MDEFRFTDGPNVIVSRMMKTMDPDLDRAISLQGIHLQ
jgi:hypothetical protein